MQNIDFNFLDQLDEKIKSGQLNQVKTELEKISSKKIPRKYALKVANLARRVGYQRMAARLLNPIIRPSSSVTSPATPEELIEYAISIMRLGSTTEALNILIKINQQKYPEASLYISFCYFSRWRYSDAVPLLELYVQNKSLSPYQIIVGKINLASAYLNSHNFEKSKIILEELLKTIDQEKNKLIIGNTHELLAEYYINKKNIKKARDHINLAFNILQKIHYRYEVYNKKWQAILKLISNRTQASGLQDLAKVRRLAYDKKLFEVIRECDYYELYFTNNSHLLFKMYFGTPHKNFRERIVNLNPKFKLQSHIIWNTSQSHVRPSHAFDVENGIDLVTEKAMKTGGLLHKLLQALCSDLYKPLSTHELFTILFPNEYYNFTHSSRKVYDLIFRLRKWFNKNNIPLLLTNTGRGEFQIETIKNYGLKIVPFNSLLESEDIFLSQIRKKIKLRSFSCQDVIHATGLSRATVKRYLNEGLKSKALIKTGNGRSVKYELKHNTDTHHIF